jgi:hypothetical protein
MSEHPSRVLGGKEETMQQSKILGVLFALSFFMLSGQVFAEERMVGPYNDVTRAITSGDNSEAVKLAQAKAREEAAKAAQEKARAAQIKAASGGGTVVNNTNTNTNAATAAATSQATAASSSSAGSALGNWVRGDRRYGGRIRVGLNLVSNFNVRFDQFGDRYQQIFQQDLGGFIEARLFDQSYILTTLSYGNRIGGLSDAAHFNWVVLAGYKIAGIIPIGVGLVMDQQNGGNATLFQDPATQKDMMAAPNRLLAAVDKSTSWGGRFEGGIDFRGVQLVAQVTLLNHDGERVPNPPQGVKKVGDDDAFVMNRGMVYYAGLAARITLWSFLSPRQTC